MKPAVEWDLGHILQLPLGEFDWVEFKGRKGLDFSLPGVDENKVLDELAKQLSAFANSGGGVLVYGVLNPMDQKPRSVDDGGISIAIKSPNTREWLEDVVPNLIEFPLKKFNVYALTNKNGAPTIADDRCIILVDIPGSDDAPHQSARDQKYYARVGGKSRPIGHRLVTDIFHRGQHALFEVRLAFQSKTWVPRTFPPIPALYQKSKPVRGVELIVGAENRGKVYAKHVKFTLWMPEEIVASDDRDSVALTVLDGGRYYVFERTNRTRDVTGIEPTFGTKRYGASWLDPILPSESRVWQFRCSSRLRPDGIKDQLLRWEILCDNAPPLSQQIELKNIPFDVQDSHQAGELGVDPYM